MKNKEPVQVLDYYTLVEKGCSCCLHVTFRPFNASEIIYDDSCPIHTEQWRRDYLGLPT